MNYYIKHVMVKIEREAPVVAMKAKLTGVIEQFQKEPGFSQVRVLTDVDPQ